MMPKRLQLMIQTPKTSIGKLINIPKTNYGEDFLMLINPDTNKFHYHWVEESSNDVMTEAVYARQEKVREHLGVYMFAEARNDPNYDSKFKTAVKNKDGSVDFMLSHVNTSTAALVTGGFLTDFRKMESINLDADYWNLEFMEQIALTDSLYFGRSDYNILYTYVVVFNKQMLAKYGNHLDESVYEMVDNYHWTLDKLISLAELVYIDKTADGKTEDDTFGISGEQWVEFIGFMHSSDINIMAINDQGKPEVCCFGETTAAKTAQLVEKLKYLVESNSALFSFRKDKTPVVPMSTGRTLFALYSTSALEQLLNSGIEFGILPYPMFDESQKDIGYRSLQWGGYQCIPSYVDNFNMVGDTLEVLSFYSDPVNVAFYEKLLGKQASDLPDDRRMLDIVWNGICSDIAQTYNIDILYMVPYLTKAGAEQSLASYMASNQISSNKKIKQIYMSLQKIED